MWTVNVNLLVLFNNACDRQTSESLGLLPNYITASWLIFDAWKFNAESGIVWWQDPVIYERLADDQPYRDITFQHLADFASLGNNCLLLYIINHCLARLSLHYAVFWNSLPADCSRSFDIEYRYAWKRHGGVELSKIYWYTVFQVNNPIDYFALLLEISTDLNENFRNIAKGMLNLCTW